MLFLAGVSLPQGTGQGIAQLGREAAEIHKRKIDEYTEAQKFMRFLVLHDAGNDYVLSSDVLTLAFSKSNGCIHFVAQGNNSFTEESKILQSDVLLIGIIRAFDYVFVLLSHHPHVQSSDGAKPEQSLSPLRLLDAYILTQDNCPSMVTRIVTTAVKDVARFLYADPAKAFDPKDPYCYNRYLFPLNDTTVFSFGPLASALRKGKTHSASINPPIDSYAVADVSVRFFQIIPYVFSGFFRCDVIGSLRIALTVSRMFSRADFRYFNRGISPTGQTANTCRVSLAINGRTIYTLFRGSVLIKFSQKLTPTFTPPIAVHDVYSLNAQLMESHLLALLYSQADSVARGGSGPPGCKAAPSLVRSTPMIFLNLLRAPKGADGEERPSLERYDACSANDGKFPHRGEKLLSYLYSAYIGSLSDSGHASLRYMSLDLHAVDALTVSQTASTLVSDTFEGDNQVGYVRINCLDCVDRTTLLQTELLCEVLRRHLKHVGAPQLSRTLETLRELSIEAGTVVCWQYMESPPQRRLRNLLPRYGRLAHVLDRSLDILISLYRYIVGRYRQQLSVFNQGIWENRRDSAYSPSLMVCLNLPSIVGFLLMLSTLLTVYGHAHDSILFMLFASGSEVLLIALVLLIAMGVGY